MTFSTGIPPNGPSKYTGPLVAYNTVVTRNRAPTGADYRQPETGKLYPFNTFWLVGKNPTTGTQGDLWYLSKIAGNIAFWVMLSSAGAAGPIDAVDVDTSTPPGTDPVIGNLGLITITGGQVATGVIGTNVIRTNSLAASSFTIEIQRSTAVAASDITKNGVSHFDSAAFDVDANGFVTLNGGGNIGASQFTLQAATAPGVNPVIPTAGGNVNINGAVVANHSVVLESRTRALNSINLEVQYAAAAAATDGTKSGVAHFNSASFTVDANGFVSLIGGGGTAATSFGVQANTAPGTNPVLPTAGGLVTINGTIVTNHSIPLRTNSLAANTYNVEAQYATTAAAATANQSGMCHFDSAQFTCDPTNGFVSLVGGGSFGGQDAFLAVKNAAQNAVTGIGQIITVTFGNEIFDPNNCYDGVSTYTAPATGRYSFCASIGGSLSVGGGTYITINFASSNRTLVMEQYTPTMNTAGSGLYEEHCGSCTMDMDIGDTCVVLFTANGGSNVTGDIGIEGNFGGFRLS